MAIKFQYNKTALQALNKQLRIRQRALPTLQNKESALRMEVKRAKDQMQRLESELESKIKQFENMSRLWVEFRADLVSISDVKLNVKKIAGVKTPVLEEIVFATGNFNLFNQPVWYLDGIDILKQLARVGIEKEFFRMKMELLDYARKKTTQKVNLYDKVQIPGYEDAIRKIKRFMEDEENLSKSAQKIVKKRQQEEAEEVEP